MVSRFCCDFKTRPHLTDIALFVRMQSIIVSCSLTAHVAARTQVSPDFPVAVDEAKVSDLELSVIAGWTSYLGRVPL